MTGKKKKDVCTDVAVVQSKQDVEKLCYDFLLPQKNVTDQEKKMFVEIAKRFNLNPFIRELYLVAYGEGKDRVCNIITGYEVYLKRANESERLDGWKVWTEGSLKDNDLKAVIEIKRKDWSEPFRHEVYYSEYVQMRWDKEQRKKVVNSMWSSKPLTMIKKVAMGQGFRLAFPVELGGMPYLSEEIVNDDLAKQSVVVADVKPEVVKTEPILNDSQDIDPKDYPDTKNVNNGQSDVSGDVGIKDLDTIFEGRNKGRKWSEMPAKVVEVGIDYYSDPKHCVPDLVNYLKTLI